jgi:hypothetical protein
MPQRYDTVESLAMEIEELRGEQSRVREFLNEQFDACSCEHCGRIQVRKHMRAPYRLDRGSDGKPLPQLGFSPAHGWSPGDVSGFAEALGH